MQEHAMLHFRFVQISEDWCSPFLPYGLSGTLIATNQEKAVPAVCGMERNLGNAHPRSLFPPFPPVHFLPSFGAIATHIKSVEDGGTLILANLH